MASLEVDLNKIEPGQTITVKWRGKPVFVKRRTPEDIELANNVDIKTLRDPQTDSERVQNPEVRQGFAAKHVGGTQHCSMLQEAACIRACRSSFPCAPWRALPTMPHRPVLIPQASCLQAVHSVVVLADILPGCIAQWLVLVGVCTHLGECLTRLPLGFPFAQL